MSYGWVTCIWLRAERKGADSLAMVRNKYYEPYLITQINSRLKYDLFLQIKINFQQRNINHLNVDWNDLTWIYERIIINIIHINKFISLTDGNSKIKRTLALTPAPLRHAA